MRIISETSILNFEFWAGAKDIAGRMTTEELENIEFILEDIYGDEGLTDTQLNDIFWFECDWLCEMLGIDVDEFIEREVN